MDKINILGVNVTSISQAQALTRIQEFLNGRKQRFIVTPNPEIILEATTKDEELHYILNYADLALADGIALKFAAWFYGKNLRRTTGADLLLDILVLAEEKRYKVAVFSWSGGLSGAEDIKLAIIKKFPGIAVYVQAIERGEAVDFTAVNKFAPDIALCALGAPFQEKFIYHNLVKIPSAKIGMSLGGSFDFLTGKAKRAPKVLRQIGLEWLWRLIKRPKRWRRIYKAVVIFSKKFFLWRLIYPHLYRSNVVCMLYKKDLRTGGKIKYKILIVERSTETGHWQLPQGGTDGQSLEAAGSRELNEEINNNKFAALASFPGLHIYEFDKRITKFGVPIKQILGYRGQKQGLFIAEFFGQDSEIKVNFWDHRAWRWVEAEKLVATVHPVRREAAKIFMEKFWQTMKK